MNNLIVNFYVNETNKELLKQIITNLGLKNEQNFELDVEKNSDSDKIKSKEFPDGFLYFPFIVAYYKEDKQYSDDDIFNSKLILEFLWEQKIPAVASCDFEYLLPENGGYKSKNIPWN